MAMQKKVICPKCDRRFSMPAHLARHMNTIHGTGQRKAGAAHKGRRGRRRSAVAAEMSTANPEFAGLSLAQLCSLIDLARAEAKRRLEQM